MRRTSKRLYIVLLECFRSDIKIWYTIELGELEKDLLRLISLKR